MCKITVYEYACKHHIQHVWSACRGLVKVTRNSDTPACQKSPSLYIHVSNKCGSCTREASEKSIRDELSRDPSSDTSEILNQRLAAVKIPSSNWKAPQPPVFRRRPSQKRLRTRTTSLLRWQVEADSVVTAEEPIFGPVSDTWNTWESTPDIKSLAEEVAEDKEARGEGVDGDNESEAEETNASEAEDDGSTISEQDNPTALDSSEPSPTVSPQVQRPPRRAKRPAPKFPSDNSKHYWYKQHKSNTSGSKNEGQVWELVVVQVN